MQISPLPSMPVIKDLIPDLTMFYAQYASIEPWLHTDTPQPEKEWIQSPEDREKLDGLYECILCACCTTSCPQLLVERREVPGPGDPAARLPLADRQPRRGHRPRLDELEDPFKLYRCHTIMNCAQVCPKGLNPAQGHRRGEEDAGGPGRLRGAKRGF